MNNEATVSEKFFLNDGLNGFWFDGRSLWIQINNHDNTIKDFLNRQLDLITIYTAKVVDQTPIVLGDEQCAEQKTLWRADDPIFGWSGKAATLFEILKEDFLGLRKDTECRFYPDDEFKGRDVKTFTADEFVRWIDMRCDLCGGDKSEGAKKMFADYVDYKCMPFNPGCYQFDWRDGSCCCDVCLSLQKDHKGPYDQLVKGAFTLGDWSAVDHWVDYLKAFGY